MGSVNLTNGITGFFSVFSTLVDIMKNTVFTIGNVTFSLWALMWSVVFFEMFIYFLYRVITGE